VSAYCTVAEVGTLGIKRDAYAGKTKEEVEQQIVSTSDFIDSFLGSRYTLPLLVFPDVIKECCADLAAIALIRGGGVDPDADQDIITMRKEWVDWLKLVAAGTVTPPGVTDSTPGATPGSSPGGGGRITSSPSRGYSVRGTGSARGPFQTS
jgi:phage gp36-like protein